jgi:riboflavin kinase/FMN adenylyltransferase
MQVFRRLAPPALRHPCALTIGNFDGVHRGHQALLARLRAQADQMGLPAHVLTFEPHPREFFAARGRGQAPARISTLRDKLQALAACGVDRVDIAHFNARMAEQSAEAFIAELLQGLQARWILIGDDFRFGAARRGDFEMLRRVAADQAVGVEQMSTVMDTAGERISSSAVREALGEGDMARAAQLLGRPYSVSGHVIHGRKLGRTLGFATLNLRIPFGQPALSGIFACRVHGLGDTALDAVASLGTRPAVERGGRWLLEVHVLDFSAEVYGRRVQVDLLHRLREERHYPNLELLTDQIRMDAQQARQWLSKHPLPPIATEPRASQPCRI